jgi:hypothetical protein
VEDWSIEELFYAIVPLDIHARLLEDEYRCVATLGVSKKPKSPQRCAHKHSRSAKTAEAALEAFYELKKSTGDKILRNMEIVFRSSMCGSHIGVSARKMNMLKKRLESETQVSEMRELIKKDAKAAAPVTSKTEPVPTQDPKTLPVNQTEPLCFEPYQPPKTASNYVDLAVCKLAITDLSEKEDRKTGSIYIYWLKPDCRRLKIGYTARTKHNPTKRLQEQRNDCAKDYQFHESSPHAITLPHVRRVEKLIHEELKEYRKMATCDSCSRRKGKPVSHNEWFDIDKALVVMVYQKWKDWILTHPYEDDGKNNWILKKDALRSLGEVCKPVEVPKEPILPCRKEETTVKQIGRRMRKATEDVVRERRKGGITVPSRAASAVECC